MNSNLSLESPQKILNLETETEDNEINTSPFWDVVANKTKVLKDWKELVLSCPKNAIRCYDHLRQTPMQRRSGRIFPLRGKKFKGAWEYEITGADRVFYVPLPKEKKVVVYYAGKHPVKNKYPKPPDI